MPDPPPDTGTVSPLTLLREQRGVQLDHALFLTFTLDLQYFERVALSTLRTAGARVTVVADAYASAQDPRSVRWAGRTYLAGHAAAAGAFHPKLVLLLGPDHAVAAVGSGNLTPSGWQRNAELWTVLRTTGDSAPATLGELVEWLRHLNAAVALGPGVADALTDAADHLARILTPRTPVATDSRILHNLQHPIIDQLATGPTRHLAVSAPFHDPRAATLHALRARLVPAETTVVIQPGKTRLDATATRTELAHGQGRILQDAQPDPYRHGKLVEWVDHVGQQWALTGSPNLTATALREPTATGNCELAVLTPVDAALLPAAEPVDLDHCPTLPPAEARHIAGPHLLGALLTPDHVAVSLAAPLPAPGQIRVWAAGDIEERWRPAATIPAGAREHAISLADLDEQLTVPGSRYRLAADDGEIETLSNVVFLTGQAALQPATPTTTGDDVGWDELVHDPAALKRLLDLIQEAEDHLEPAPHAANRERQRHTTGPWPNQVRQWEALAGTTLVRAVIPTDSNQAVPTDIDDATGPTMADGIANLDNLISDRALDEDPDADQPDVEQPTTDVEDNGAHDARGAEGDEMTDRSEQAARNRDMFQRRVYRRGTQWAGVVVTQPLIVRLIGLRFALHGLGYARTAPAAEACTRLDWHHLLVSFTAAVGEGAVPTDAEPAAGSLVAVALAVLDELCRDTDDQEQVLAATRRLATARDAAAYLTLAADPDRLAHHANDLDGQYGYVVHPTHVLELVEQLTRPDPYRDAADQLDDPDLTIEVSGALLVIHTDTPRTPRRIALEAIGNIPPTHPAAALATTPRGRCLAVHHGNQLLLVEQEEHRPPLWRLHHLTGPTAPTRRLLAGRATELTRWEQRRTGPLTVRPASADELLSAVGLEPPTWTKPGRASGGL